jgi:hypothetical protein
MLAGQCTAMARMTGPHDASERRTGDTYRAWRRLLRAEDAWLLRQIGSLRPVLWLRPQPLGAAARHGILALRAAADGQLRGPLRTDARCWPWADDAVPAVVLQHVCEGAPWGGELLREAARVLAPEGRLYVLRFDRLSPWYWRYGGHVVRHSGAPLLPWRRLDLRGVQEYGLSLEYRHALGSRGFSAGSGLLPRHQRTPERWPFLDSLRATRIWVLRKRRRQWVLRGRRAARAVVPAGYGLARSLSDQAARVACPSPAANDAGSDRRSAA